MTCGLIRFGYTKREAAFLELAALLSGYFVRRQFNEFIGRECGALGQGFIERAQRLGHMRVLAASGNRQVLHICGSGVYAGLLDENNRNRREHRPETVRRRLMGLDFAISQKERAWLLTEREKVAQFEAAGISKRDLPQSAFRSRTQTFFVDKQPIARGADGQVELGFIDEGLRGFSKWQLFLKQHRLLFQQLRGSIVIYASPDPTRFRPAEAVFRRTVAGESPNGGLDLVRLKRYFSVRKLFDEKIYESFDQSRLDELRENRRVFSGDRFESLYQAWRTEGESALRNVRVSETGLRTHLLPHSYEWLSPIRTKERRGQACP